MHAPKYTKLDANLNPLPDDHPNDGPDKHLAVRVEHLMLKEPIVVSAYRCTPERVTFDKAQEIAAKFDAYGWTWRTPTLEELFFVADRTRGEVGMDTNFFPDAESYEGTWTSDVDATSPRGNAWLVFLGGGSAVWGGQSNHGHVRAVRAGQVLGDCS